MQAYLNTAIKAARKAGDIAQINFDRIESKDVRTKSYNEFATHVDEQAERAIIEIIRSRYPEHSILGEEHGVSGLILSSTKNENTIKINLNGVFIAIGHDPSTACFKKTLKLDSEGYVVLKGQGNTFTHIDGVFAAGDCVDKVYRQAVTAAGMGCMAALDAEKWLQSN